MSELPETVMVGPVVLKPPPPLGENSTFKDHVDRESGPQLVGQCAGIDLTIGHHGSDWVGRVGVKQTAPHATIDEVALVMTQLLREHVHELRRLLAWSFDEEHKEKFKGWDPRDHLPPSPASWMKPWKDQ